MLNQAYYGGSYSNTNDREKNDISCVSVNNSQKNIITKHGVIFGKQLHFITGNTNSTNSNSTNGFIIIYLLS